VDDLFADFHVFLLSICRFDHFLSKFGSFLSENEFLVRELGAVLEFVGALAADQPC
jgi:hypothetical protein